MFVFSCELTDAIKSVNKMPDKMDTLGDNTAEMERLTVVGKMKDEVENEKNYDVLAPIPYKLIAPSKKLAENFTLDEAIGWIYTRQAYVEGANVLDRYPDAIMYDENGNVLRIAPEAIAFEENKIGTASAISAVSAFLPDALINQMVERIYNGEKDSKTMIHILAMRYNFISQVMLKEKYAKSNLTVIGEVEEAIQYLYKLESIANLHFVNSINMRTTSFVIFQNANENLTYGVDVSEVHKYWLQIADGFERYLKVGAFANSDAQKQSQVVRIQNAKVMIDQGLARSQKYNKLKP